MKVTLDKFEEGIRLYVSKEICPKLTDWRKWVIPVMIGMFIPKIDNLFQSNKDSLILSGFVDAEGLIDIDSLYENFYSIAEESGDIVQEIPFIGTLKLSSRDIESFYKILKTEDSKNTSLNISDSHRGGFI